jgi:ABC-type sugar transport system substrate-binding protein
MKKICALLQVCLVTFSVFAGGASQGGAGTDAAKPLKMAVALSDSGASIFSVMGNNVKAFAETAGGQVFFESARTPDAQIAFVENYISAGATAIIISPVSDAVGNTINTLCDEAGVYWGIPFRRILDPEVKGIVEGSKYFVGNCYEDEKNTAYELGKFISSKGLKRIAFISLTIGDTTAGLREEGLQQACQEFGMRIVAEARELQQATDVTKAVESFLSAHNDLDCVFILSTKAGGALQAAGKAIIDSGRGDKVKIACVDFQDGMVDLFEKGILIAASGLPHWGYDPFMTVVKTANAAMGKPVTQRSFTTSMKMMMLTSADMAKSYEKAFASSDRLYYTKEEMHNKLIKANNPALDEKEFQSLVNSFNPLQ